jgi:SagB-type dehydrogenase family enzyme
VREPPSANRATRAALAYHEATAHTEWSVRTSTHVLDRRTQPLPFKIYRDLESVPLPAFPAREGPALVALAEPASRPRSEPPDLVALARVLQLAAGITKRMRHPGGEILLRAYPNTGALHHVDLYLVAGELPDLAAGVYHFSPHDFALRRLRAGDYRAVLVEASGGCPEVARAAVVIASASTWWRNAWKYQARAWRHVFWDGGTLHANLLAVAQEEGLEPSVVMGYADAALDLLLGLDPRREGGIALVPLGRAAAPPPAPAASALRLAVEPVSRAEIDYPAIRDAQAASDLQEDEAATWRAAAAPAEALESHSALVPLRPLAESALPRDSLDAVIRRRGSTRVFDRERSLRFEELSTALDRSTRGVPADFLGPPPATLLDLYLIVHAVEDLAPGAYLYHRAERALELLREGRFRQAAGRLALGQALAADAAVNIYSLTDLTRVFDRFGNRGYRAAQLEGGITGGRLYLAAYALGFGATGLTFFDHEVTDFFSPHAAGKSVMFLTALGHPDRVALGLQPRRR